MYSMVSKQISALAKGGSECSKGSKEEFGNCPEIIANDLQFFNERFFNKRFKNVGNEIALFT